MSKFFINRPIVAIVIAILTVIIGTVSMLTLPTSQFPDIVPTEILVTATYPGADAKTLAQAVATPIEQQMNGVDNMIYMDSVSANNGVVQLFVDFDVKTDPNIDQVLSQLRVDQAQSQLPAQVTTAGLTVQKALTSPLMLIAVNSPGNKLSQDFLTNYAIINLQDQITRVKGVSRVQIFGGQYALRIWVDPNKLAKLGVTAPEVIQAIQTQNNVNPAGQIGAEPIPKGQQFTYTVRTQGRLVKPEEFGAIILRANADGSILHLSDVARIELGDQAYAISGRYNQNPSGVMAVYQLPGSNAVATAAAVNARMKELAATFPTGISYNVPLDTTKAVSSGIHEIVITLLEALALVVVVVFIFLQGWRATLIPLLAVPVSLIGTFIIFLALGFSVNTLSLFGLVLAIGLVVDDAIIVVEAVEHHIDEGMDPKDATIKAMEEVGGPGRGDRSHPCCRVHSDGLHSRDHGPTLSTVCGDDRHLGAHLGVQRTYAVSRIGFASAEAEERRKETGSAWQGIRTVQQVFWTHDRELRPHVGCTHSQVVSCDARDCDHRGLWSLPRQHTSGRLSANRRPGVHVSCAAASRRRFGAAHGRSPAEDHCGSSEDAWR